MAALPSQLSPQILTEPSVARVAELVGSRVSQVDPLADPLPKSISQLMFFEGVTNTARPGATMYWVDEAPATLVVEAAPLGAVVPALVLGVAVVTEAAGVFGELEHAPPSSRRPMRTDAGALSFTIESVCIQSAA